MDGGHHHVDLTYQHNHHPTPSSHHHHHNHRNDNHHHNHRNGYHHYNRNDYIDIQPVISNSTNNRRRNQPQSAYYSTSSSSSSASIKGCCCCLILVFSFLALLVLTVVLVVVLAVKPKKPHFDLEQVGVQYINLAAPVNTPTTASSASLSLAIRMLFVAKNDNTVGIKYGVSTFNIMYRGIPLGRGTVPGFYQPAHSVRQVQTTVTVNRVNLLQADAVELVRDASVNDRVMLRIIGDVNAKIRILGLTSPSVQVS